MRTIFAACACVFVLLASCKSKPKESLDNLTAPQIMQLGQEAYGNLLYKSAAFYYDEVLNRFGDETRYYIEAKYELGRIALKKKKYDDAYANFNEIIELYYSSGAGNFPAEFKKLAEISIKQIPEGKLSSAKTEE